MRHANGRKTSDTRSSNQPRSPELQRPALTDREQREPWPVDELPRERRDPDRWPRDEQRGA